MVAACWLALPLLVACALAQTRVGAPAPGTLPASWPARIGDHVVSGEAEARFRLQAARPGSEVPFQAGELRGTIPVVPAYGFFHHVVTFVTGLLFWAACLFAFAPRADTEPGRTFLWASLGYALAIMAGDVHFPAPPAWPNTLFPLARLFALLCTPVLFLRIALLFPRPDPRVRVRLLVGAVAVVAALLFAAEAWFLLDDIAHGTPGTFARLEAARRGATAFLVLLVLGGGLYLARAPRRAVLARERQQAKWVAWGSIVGVMPFALLHALPLALGQRPLLPVDLARLCAVVVPLSYGIAVARHQFLNIDLIIRRSLIYGTMAALLTVFYLALGLVLGGGRRAFSIGARELLLIVSAGTAVALFRPTRRWLGRRVDRTFFGLRTGHGREADALRATLAVAPGPDEVLAELSRALHGALAPQRLRVVSEGADPVARAAARLVAGSPRATSAAPESTGQPELERADWPEELAAAGFVLVQPLVADGGPHGAVLLGAKSSERRYVEEDLEFLADVTGVAGRTLERVVLERRAAEESFLRARQSELDRQKTAFLSRVAHDLRTPLTSILWSSRNVLDGVRGPVEPGVAEAVGSMHASAAMLGRLVENLTDVARLESDGAIPPLERIDAGLVVGEAVLALEPIARAREVALAVALDARLPAVRARRDGLSRIVVNLVENAIKFSPRGGRVTVALCGEAAGGVVLSVADGGPGVPVEERKLVFGLYRQGRSGGAVGGAGIGVGFGVGLSVVHEWVERFGGTIDIEEPPGGGARFVCRLRAWEGGETWPRS
jgi:signal transduction histidine kinase